MAAASSKLGFEVPPEGTLQLQDTPTPQFQCSVSHAPTQPSRPGTLWSPSLMPFPRPKLHLLWSASVTKSFPDFLFPLNSSTSRGEPPRRAMVVQPRPQSLDGP